MNSKLLQIMSLTCICVLLSSCTPLSPDYQRWNPANAERDAERDIEAGEIKICYHGGIAAGPEGIPLEYYDLIKDFPVEDAGIGCIVEDLSLRQRQAIYATRYNKRILKHLLETQ